MTSTTQRALLDDFAQAAGKLDGQAVSTINISGVVRATLRRHNSPTTLYAKLATALRRHAPERQLVPARPSVAADPMMAHLGLLVAVCPRNARLDAEGYVDNAEETTMIIALPLVGDCTIVTPDLGFTTAPAAPQPENVWQALEDLLHHALEVLQMFRWRNATADADKHIANAQSLLQAHDALSEITRKSRVIGELLGSDRPWNYVTDDESAMSLALVQMHIQLCAWELRLPLPALYYLAQGLRDLRTTA